MKQIKPILSTILLLLLLTSISYGWVPPNINSPVLLDETDADPWGETLASGNKAEAALDLTPNNGEIISAPVIKNAENFAIMAVRLILFIDMTAIIKPRIAEESLK
jgi:hypothetical protein